MDDYREARLTAADRVMLDYVIKLTLQPAAVTRGDLDELRAAGFDDAAIHHVVQITALFAYYNRVVDGLGGAAEPEW